MALADAIKIAEVPLSAHSITLEHGTYCVFVTAVSTGVAPADLPALQISTAPGSSSVALGCLPGDGWLRRVGDAVLIRVVNQQSRLLLTSYDEARVDGAKPPQIQVQRLDDGRAPAFPPVAATGIEDSNVLAHIRRHGDRPGPLGGWLGQVGDDSWIEGFEIRPPPGLASEELEYQVVLGRGWLSPWVQAGDFCGSRGMGLPILGFRVRLLGEAAGQWRLRYAARCVDGQELPELGAGGHCEAAELVPLAALKISLEALVAMPDAAKGQAAKKKPGSKKA
jgi:hypothetical protein